MFLVNLGKNLPWVLDGIGFASFPHLDPDRTQSDDEVCFSIFLLGRAVGLAWRYWGPEGSLNEMAVEKNDGLQQLAAKSNGNRPFSCCPFDDFDFDGCSSCKP